MQNDLQAMIEIQKDTSQACELLKAKVEKKRAKARYYKENVEYRVVEIQKREAII